MHAATTDSPGADRRTGCREATGADRHSLTRRGDRVIGVIVGDPDPPVIRRRGTGDRHVAAETDQDAAADTVCQLLRAPVRGPRLGGGPQVDLGAVVEPGTPAALTSAKSRS